VARSVLFILLAVALVAAGGWAGAKAVGLRPHGAELLIAAAGATLAAMAALVPLWLARGTASQPPTSQEAASQAALLSTVVHMLVAVAVAAGVIFIRRPGAAFIYWMLAFYWVTLAAVAAAAVRLIRSAGPAKTST